MIYYGLRKKSTGRLLSFLFTSLKAAEKSPLRSYYPEKYTIIELSVKEGKEYDLAFFDQPGFASLIKRQTQDDGRSS
jgi:hypothetical protein